ncbi:MAG: UDP-N-acetylglucosamine--N-acetylmuramyl- (pentapeptide) pyrophosphoryl-undecaprenol [Candidatus Saccharibacteria bacterium]|nr:UDP-N-acetylglucosamine--N-acetylmuramyl- (pentapeptide) pyrophosphoryl-undecaprenol [Candidatus Saccharibacteria bacterium]
MSKTIVVTGGGSGGHITPILAVAAELKSLQPDTRIVYIGQTGDKLADIPAGDPNIDEVFTVRAGKFRRYHGEGFFRQLFDVPTVAKNLRDIGYILIGTWQSWRLLRKLKPSVIFSRGGFVSVPVALGGALQRIPYITHDSDSTPSLANRIIARWASLHAVALPAELYPYPPDKTVTVGVPISADYKRVTPALLHKYRDEIGLTKAHQVLLITGGGNGADQLNRAVVANSAYLLQRYPGLHIVHIAGRALHKSVAAAYDNELPADARARVVVKGFIGDLYRYSGAADVVIARGGATNLAEFAAQAKACIIIPSKQLIWNIKNTEALLDRQAVVTLTEAQSEQERRLASVVSDLFDHVSKREALGAALASLARPDSAKELAVLILDEAKSSKVKSREKTVS